MAKQIIVLETMAATGGGTQVNAVLWFPVAVGQEIPISNAVSKYKDISTQETADLQAGKFVEEYFQHVAPQGSTAVQVKAQLVTIYNNRLAAFNARPNPKQFYGLAYDGTNWA